MVYRYDAGVANRWSLQNVIIYRKHGGTSLEMGMRFHLNEHKGLGTISLAARDIPGPFRWMRFQAELMHREFSDYRIGENLAAGSVNILPCRTLSFVVGIGYRSANISEKHFHSPFDWNHEMNEAYFLFRFTGQLMQRERASIHFITGNYLPMEMNTLDHWMFGLRGRYLAKKGRNAFYGEVFSGVKGISGFVLSVNEVRITVGWEVRL